MDRGDVKPAEKGLKFTKDVLNIDIYETFSNLG
jgi:hypothetical protein